jgi:hypothetical protein
MFAFNPFWRGGTLGSYALLFNALLHHGHLNVGRTVTGAAVANEPDDRRGKKSYREPPSFGTPRASRGAAPSLLSEALARLHVSPIPASGLAG